MNKQELIGRIECLKNIFGNKNEYIKIDMVVELISELDEPEKVKVSEEEAKFLKTFDFNCKSDVTAALYNVSRTGYGYHLTNNNGIELKGLSQGFRNIENRKRLIEAILYGYEVEKEKRYTVKFKNIQKGTEYLKYDRVVERWYFGLEEYSIERTIYHTRKELEEDGFSWVFDCEGVEVEEVE